MLEKDTTKYVIQSSKISANLLTHILLTVFLGRFWLWPWVYKTTALLNDVKGLEFRKPSSKLALFILIPFYSIYWFRKTSKGIEFAAKKANETISLAGICTFLAFFFPKIASILIQMEIEKLTNCELAVPREKDKPEKIVTERKSIPSKIVEPIKTEKQAVVTQKNEKQALATQKTVTVTIPQEEKELEMLCPNCKENLYFMGWEHGEEAQCPFCDKKFII